MYIMFGRLARRYVTWDWVHFRNDIRENNNIQIGRNNCELNVCPPYPMHDTLHQLF